MKIGVFDSGVGGKYVADALVHLFPDDTILYVNDAKNLPYGEKTPQQIRSLTEKAITPLIDDDCKVIVVACNSATTNAIAYLRAQYPSVSFVGIEPMIKPAAQMSASRIIGVCATPATLQSARYKHLVERYGSDITILTPDCATWAGLIEAGRRSEIPLTETIAHLQLNGCDTVVLACTHYHYLKKTIEQLAPSLRILEPTDAIASRIRTYITEVRSQQQ